MCAFLASEASWQQHADSSLGCRPETGEPRLVCAGEAADSQTRGCLADPAAHVALCPSPSFPCPSGSSLPSAMTAACPKLRASGYINDSSSLKMPTDQLRCSLCCGSNQGVSCGGPCAAVSWGNSWDGQTTAALRARFGLEWPCKATWETPVQETQLEPQQPVAGRTTHLLSHQECTWQHTDTDESPRVPFNFSQQKKYKAPWHS